MTWAGLSAWNNSRLTSTQHCSIVSSTTKAYSTFHFAFVPIAYVCSFLSLCFIAFLQNKTNQKAVNLSRQKQLTTYTVMTAIDIILVTIPSFVLCGANYGLFKPNDIIHGLSYSTSGFLSLCHIGVNIGYNREYRKQLKLLFGDTVLDSLILGKQKMKAMLVYFLTLCFIISVNGLLVPNISVEAVNGTNENLHKFEQQTDNITNKGISDFDHIYDYNFATLPSNTTPPTTTYKITTKTTTQKLIPPPPKPTTFGQSVIKVIENIPGAQLAKSSFGFITSLFTG
uniref:G-protein coupled receptors family 1 profile domain-containing protein n=1 Tax=Panagrolaimus superbus TaxID=310955 RepID=A0A914Z3N1_9BILA